MKRHEAADNRFVAADIRLAFGPPRLAVIESTDGYLDPWSRVRSPSTWTMMNILGDAASRTEVA